MHIHEQQNIIFVNSEYWPQGSGNTLTHQEWVKWWKNIVNCYKISAGALADLNFILTRHFKVHEYKMCFFTIFHILLWGITWSI